MELWSWRRLRYWYEFDASTWHPQVDHNCLIFPLHICVLGRMTSGNKCAFFRWCCESKWAYKRLFFISGLAGLLERGDAPVDELVGLRAQVVGDSTLREFHNDDNMTSGSGSGMPHLVPRTLAKMIELGERIGKLFIDFGLQSNPMFHHLSIYCRINAPGESNQQIYRSKCSGWATGRFIDLQRVLSPSEGFVGG